MPADARAALAARSTPDLLEPVRVLECDDGMTRKTVWRLFDGTLVESVLMRYPRDRDTCRAGPPSASRRRPAAG